jgi:hypothetical protein
MGLTSDDSTPGLEINQIKREVAALNPSLPSAFRNPHSTRAPGSGFRRRGRGTVILPSAFIIHPSSFSLPGTAGVFVAQGVKAGGGQGLLLAANAPQRAKLRLTRSGWLC